MKPRAIIVDIDGTVADMDKKNPLARGPYDWDRVGEDLPVETIISLVHIFNIQGYKIVFVSGRMEQARKATTQWLVRHTGLTGVPLFMRDDGDMRSDTVVKRELYDNHIEPYYHVDYVLDDRNKVVAMWRGLGLSVLQVADGDF